jgi:ferritin-like metal-binding protein YciE
MTDMQTPPNAEQVTLPESISDALPSAPHWTETLTQARESGAVQSGLGFYSQSKVGPTEFVKIDGLMNMGTVDNPKLVEGGVMAFQRGKPPMHMTEKQAEAMQQEAAAKIQHQGVRALFNIAWSIPGAVFDHATRWATDKYQDPAKTLDRFRKDQVTAHANTAADALKNCRQQLQAVATHPEIAPLLKQRDIMEAKGNPNDPMHLTALRNNTRQIDAVLERNPALRDNLAQAEAYGATASIAQGEFFKAAKQANVSNPFEQHNISSDELSTLNKLSESLGADKIGEQMRDMLDNFQEAWASISEKIQNAIQQLMKQGG